MANAPPQGSSGTSYSSVATAGPSLMPRRSSYASVVSGAPMYQQPSRAGGFPHLLQQGPSAGAHFQQHQSGLHSRNGPRALDTDMYAGAGSISVPGSLGRGPSHLGQASNSSGALGMVHSQFITPSYLRGSSYVQRLAEAHRARLHSQIHGLSTHSSNAGSLSTSSSSANLHKMAPSHRGMTYDIIEKEPPTNGEALMQLPSRWSDSDKLSGLEVLADGLEVRYVGPGKSNQDHDAAAVRADHAMPPQCGIFYYEVTIICRGKEGYASPTIA
jgi:Ran-binding protein 9/10